MYASKNLDFLSRISFFFLPLHAVILYGQMKTKRNTYFHSRCRRYDA